MVVEQERYGVREDFPQQSTSKVPEVACPHPLYRITLGELRKNGVYAVAKPTEEGAPFGMWISFLGGVRSQKFHAHARQLLPPLRRMVVAIPDEQARGALGEFGEHGKLMSIGRSYGQASDDARPGYPHVYSKAVEGLLQESILAEGRLPAKAPAAVGTSEQAHRKRHRIHECEGRVVRSESEEFLPEVFLEHPEVGRLPSEGGAMHFTEGWEPFDIVAAEEEVDVLVGVSMPRNSPMISMVRTSESESFGAGPR